MYVCMYVCMYLNRLGFDDIAAEAAEFSRITFGDDVFTGMAAAVEAAAAEDEQRKKLFNYGFLNYFKSGEYHHNNQVVRDRCSLTTSYKLYI